MPHWLTDRPPLYLLTCVHTYPKCRFSKLLTSLLVSSLNYELHTLIIGIITMHLIFAFRKQGLCISSNLHSISFIHPLFLRGEVGVAWSSRLGINQIVIFLWLDHCFGQMENRFLDSKTSFIVGLVKRRFTWPWFIEDQEEAKNCCYYGLCALFGLIGTDTIHFGYEYLIWWYYLI